TVYMINTQPGEDPFLQQLNGQAMRSTKYPIIIGVNRNESVNGKKTPVVDTVFGFLPVAGLIVLAGHYFADERFLLIQFIDAGLRGALVAPCFIAEMLLENGTPCRIDRPALPAVR